MEGDISSRDCGGGYCGRVGATALLLVLNGTADCNVKAIALMLLLTSVFVMVFVFIFVFMFALAFDFVLLFSMGT